MQNRYLLAGLGVLLILSACTKNSPPSAGAKVPVATVNGKPISADTLDAYIAAVTRKPATDASPEIKTQALDQFISLQLVADLAVKNGMDKQPAVASQLSSQLELARMNVLSEAALKKYMEEHPTTDAETKAEYDVQVAALPRQYRARNILVDSKTKAEGIIERLKSGADFAKLAEKESSDPSAKSGGDMGWFALSSMLPPISNAVVGLEKGKFTQEPVQSQYGWHVIKLEDSRSPEAPPFDQVQVQVKGIVQRKKLQAYMEELRKGAKIEKAGAAAPSEKPVEKK